MKLEDSAIILSVRAFREHDAIISVLGAEHGVMRGMVRGARGRKLQGTVQPGNCIHLSWNARLEQQLGTIQLELQEGLAAYALSSAVRLYILQTAVELVEMMLPERDPHPEIYHDLLVVLRDLRGQDALAAAKDYVRLELDLLRIAGFGLDLQSCAATGGTDELIYVSPRSGRAVCREAGAPYKEKMLPLPAFLQDETSQLSVQEIQAGLQLTGHFLQQHLLAATGHNLPAVRARLAARLQDESVVNNQQ